MPRDYGRAAQNFAKALDVYVKGLLKFPKDFDLAYNK
jgi:hypothetical protein